MPPKKKTSVINQSQLDPPSREPSSVDLGYNFSGNFETDFPEFLEVLGVSPPPHVQMIKLNKDDINQLFEIEFFRAICRTAICFRGLLPSSRQIAPNNENILR